MTVTTPRGFRASGGHVGIKPEGRPDCAVVVADGDAPVAAAAVFTTSRAPAAPVQRSRANLQATGGRARAVVVTSGNANAATGAAGLDGATSLCAAAAGALGGDPREILVAQTGLIGVRFDFAATAPAVAALCGSATATPEGGAAAAEAILTTDTRPKVYAGTVGAASLGGIAKGAAMLAPNLATMLAVLTTDAACAPELLHELLAAAVEPTFNRVDVDGSTSTNDTVVVLASGLAGPVAPDALGAGLEAACGSLARQMVDDAEGATRTATVRVVGAASDDEAHRAARAVAGSLLVKCSLNGADPYWGRVVAELATAGSAFDPDRVAVRYGGLAVCRDGVACDHDAAAVAAHLTGRHVELECDLGLGPGAAAVLCCDLAEGYLAENRTTS